MAIKKDDKRYSKGSVGGSLYSENAKKTKEYIQTSRKTIIPGVVKLTGKTYEVPKGSMNTAKSERGKTISRSKTAAKVSATAASRKEATKKLSKSTSQAERGKTVARKTAVAKRQSTAKAIANKPKKLY